MHNGECMQYSGDVEGASKVINMPHWELRGYPYLWVHRPGVDSVGEK